MIPAVATRSVVEAEMAAVNAWVASHPGWVADFTPDSLQLNLDTVHPAAGVPIRISADLSGYRAIPPAWRFTATPDGAAARFPTASTNNTIVTGSIFLEGQRVICAPWNRLAFKENDGPHQDWGALTNWTTAAPGYTHAEELADMVSQIALHLSLSPGVK